MRAIEIEAIDTAWASTNDPDPLSFLLVRVRDADGYVGYGEACDCYGCFFPRTVHAALDEVVAPLVLGPDGLHPEVLAPALRAAGATSAPFVAAASAVEIALWDVLAKRQGLPVLDLLGRVRDGVGLYASNVTLPNGTVGEHVNTLEVPAGSGVMSFKARIIGGAEDVDVLDGIVGEMPVDADVMVDANERYEGWEALELAHQLHAVGARWFEEPMPYHQRAGVARLARRSPVPLAYGEHAHSVGEVLDQQTVVPSSIVQVDASACGGIAELRRMVAAAESFGSRIVPHNAAGPVAFAANLHAAASTQQITTMEFPFPLCGSWRKLSPDADALVASISGGVVHVPERPGLGVVLRDELFERGVVDLDEAAA